MRKVQYQDYASYKIVHLCFVIPRSKPGKYHYKQLAGRKKEGDGTEEDDSNKLGLALAQQIEKVLYITNEVQEEACSALIK